MRTKDVNRVYLFSIFIYLIGAAIIAFFVPAFVASPIGSVLTAQGLILLAVVVGCRMLRVEPRAHLGIRRVRPGAVGCTMLCTAALYPFLAAVSTLMQQFVTTGTGTLTVSLTDGNPLRNLLVYALLPAAAEELLNRGLLLNAYVRTAGRRRAVLLSALLFGLFHMNLDQFAYTFIFGLFLCLVMTATGSIFACIAGHFTLNMISVLLATLSTDETDLTQITLVGTQTSLVLITLLVLVTAALVFAVSFRQLLALGCGEEAFRRSFTESVRTGRPDRIVTSELVFAVLICILYMVAYEAVM